MITIDLPSAVTSPSSGKFESVRTTLLSPISMVPNLEDKSPTWHLRGFAGPHSCRYSSSCWPKVLYFFQSNPRIVSCTLIQSEVIRDLYDEYRVYELTFNGSANCV